jgi:hypothetical protein
MLSHKFDADHYLLYDMMLTSFGASAGATLAAYHLGI